QAQAVQLQDTLEVGEQHLNLLPPAAGREIGLVQRQITSEIACALVDRAQDLAGRHVGRAALLEAAGVAVELARAVAHQAVLIDERAWFAIHLPSLPQALAARADVAVVGMILDEVGSFERAVASCRLVEHGDVRLDALLLDESSEVGRIAISSV